MATAPLTPQLAPADFINTAKSIEQEVGKVIVGQDDVIRGILTCVLAGGHALLEGVPGLGKTMLVRTLSEVLDLSFSRVQFTPDLMPADITGTNVISEDGGIRGFQFQPGPIFANLVLADEINRATPKTQSALLEAMQEQTVTVGALGSDGLRAESDERASGERRAESDEPRTSNTGRLGALASPRSLAQNPAGPLLASRPAPPARPSASRPLPSPFFVLATQNPIELEGTYPLPEAQLDRFFFKLRALSPSVEELETIVDRTTTGDVTTVRPVATGPTLLQMQRLAREVPVAAPVRNYVARLVVATHPDTPGVPEAIRRYVRFGASPRAAQALIIAGKITALLAGRFNVAFEDIRRVAPAALRHRLILNVEAQVAGVEPDAIIADLLRTLPEQAR